MDGFVKIPKYVLARFLTVEVRKAMTSKEKAIGVIQALNDDVSLDEVIDRLYLLRKIELGIAQADAGDVVEHEAFMDELVAEDAQ
jgi:predicted transcriptional regulator